MTVTPDITDDFETYVDNIESVTLTIRGGDSYTAKAHRNQVQTLEHRPDGGDIRQGDLIWHVSATMDSGEELEDLSEVPLGSTLTDPEGLVWTILNANLQVWRSKWEFHTRNLTIVAGLDTLVTLQHCTYTKDINTGERVETWTDHTTSIRAKIQPQTKTPEIEHDTDETEELYEVVLESSLSIVPGESYRIVDSSSDIYRVISYQQPDQISSLPYLVVRKA